MYKLAVHRVRKVKSYWMPTMTALTEGSRAMVSNSAIEMLGSLLRV